MSRRNTEWHRTGVFIHFAGKPVMVGLVACNKRYHRAMGVVQA